MQAFAVALFTLSFGIPAAFGIPTAFADDTGKQGKGNRAPVIVAAVASSTFASTLASTPGTSASLESLTLIGSSGEVFEPSPSGGWKRINRGGVACRVKSAYRVGGDLWAACASAPLFRFRDGVWSAEPVNNRGRIEASQIGTSALVSIGRHLYSPSRAGSWERQVSAPSRLRSLLAASTRRGVAITTRREVVRIAGTLRRPKWKTIIAAPKRRRSTDDLPRTLFGSARDSYIVYDSGRVAHLGAKRAKKLNLPGGNASLSPSAACVLSSGSVLVAGSVAKTQAVLLRFAGSKVTTFPLPKLATNDEVTALQCVGDSVLLATSTGAIFVRKNAQSDESAWSALKIDTSPPPEINKASPAGRPAPTR